MEGSSTLSSEGAVSRELDLSQQESRERVKSEVFISSPHPTNKAQIFHSQSRAPTPPAQPPPAPCHVLQSLPQLLLLLFSARLPWQPCGWHSTAVLTDLALHPGQNQSAMAHWLQTACSLPPTGIWGRFSLFPARRLQW